MSLRSRRSLKYFAFSFDDPTYLHLETETELLFRSVRRLGQWNRRALDVTGSVLVFWTNRAIAQGDYDDAYAVRSLIRRLQVILPHERQPAKLEVEKEYRRWSGIESVLDSRIHILSYNNGQCS